MRSLCLIALIAVPATAHGDDDPKVAPYEKLFTLDATSTLPCFVQRQTPGTIEYGAACTPKTCEADGQLVCTVKETKQIGKAGLARLVCTRTKADGTSSTGSGTWGVRTSKGMWNAGDKLPTRRQLAVLLRTKPNIAAHPIVGTIKKKLDPDGEDDRIEGGWSDTRYCLDTDAGKSNPSWSRWCISRAGGLVGTFRTHAEAIKGERCGDPF
jgi:hypothetical protein